MTRRRRRFPEPLSGVAAGVAVALVLVWLHHPRFGLRVLAATLVGAALLRLLLPARDAGLLVIRTRPLDVAILAGAAVCLFVVASVTPFPRPGH